MNIKVCLFPLRKFLSKRIFDFQNGKLRSKIEFLFLLVETIFFSFSKNVEVSSESNKSQFEKLKNHHRNGD